MMEQLFECVCVQVNNDRDTNVFAFCLYRPPKVNMLECLNALKKVFDYAAGKMYKKKVFSGGLELKPNNNK